MKIFIEKEIFENIIVFHENTPNWYKIFCYHAEIFINLTDDDLKAEIVQGTPIFEYILVSHGKTPKALKYQFDNIYEDAKYLLDFPRSAYFLNISPAEASTLQEQYGIVVQSSDAIIDDIFKGSAHRELLRDMTLKNSTKTGWKWLFDFPLPPSNSIVISDDWLFKNEENGNIIGEDNLVSLLDAVLPASLQTEYHVLVITDDQARSQQKCEKLNDDLTNKISALRVYPIVFELVFADTDHKRKAILNYLSVTCDKGFAMFRLNDLFTVRDDNDFRYEKSFNRIEELEGDTVFYSDTIILKKIKDKCNTVKKHNMIRLQDPNRRIMGDWNKNKSLKNRLIDE